MRIVGVTMVKDEQDVIGYTLLHLFSEGVDHLIVADNLSTDNTRLILDEFQADGMPVTIVDDPEPGHYQGRKMTALAERAVEFEADWVIAFDADELWYSPTGTIADTLAETDADVILAVGYDHMATENDPPVRNPFQRIQHRRSRRQALPKVAFRPIPGFDIHEGNHGVTHPGRREAGTLEFRHFQYRTFPQMCRKLRQGKTAMEATNLPWIQGTHWRVLGSLTDEELWALWSDYCHEEGLVHDPAPYRVVPV